MKIRELANHWEENAKGRLTDTGYSIHLDVEAAARLAAIIEMYPKRHPEELLGELDRGCPGRTGKKFSVCERFHRSGH